MTKAAGAPLTVTVSVRNITSNIYNGSAIFSDGSVSAFVSGGQAPYTFTLMEALGETATNNNGYFIFVPPNTYWVSVTDALGAVAISNTFTVTTVYPTATLPEILFTRVIRPSECNSNDGTIIVEGINGTSPYTYSIDGGVTFTGNNSFTGLNKGQYAFLVKDANGLLAINYTHSSFPSDSLYFNCGCCPFEIYALGSSTFSCYGTDGNFSVYGPATGAIFTYSIDGVNYYNADNNGLSNSKTFTPMQPGLHTGYVKDSSGFVSKFSSSLAYYCRVRIEYTSVAATCGQSDGAVTIHAMYGEPPYTYTMDGTNYQQDSTFTGLSVGNNNFSVKDASGDIHSAGAFIFDKCPAVSAGSTSATCNRSNGTITAYAVNGTRPYRYSLDSVSYQADSVFTGLPAGNYIVYLTDALGYTATTTVSITGGYCLAVTASADSSTCGNSNGRIIVNASNSIPPYEYSKDRVNFFDDNILTDLPPGAYTVYAKDWEGNIDSATAIIAEKSPPSITLITTNTSDCYPYNGSMEITAAGSGPFSYSIDSSLYQTEFVFTAINSGQHTAFVKDGNGCVVSTIVIVPLNDNLKITLADTVTACIGAGATINTQSNASSYQWSPPASLNDALAQSPVANPVTTTVYHVNVVLGNCSKEDSVMFLIKEKPPVNLGSDTTLCEGTTTLLNAFINNAAYIWQDNSTSSTFSVSEQGTYNVSVNKDGCIAKDTINIGYTLKPRFTLGANQLICTGQPITLRPTIEATWQLLWQDGSTAPSYIVTKAGTYSLQATNTCGSMTDEVIFTEGLCNIYIPSAFTPNGDRWNNEFKVSGTALVTQFRLQVFNRYGQLMFETADKNKGWDGLYKTQPAKAGAYVYVLQYKASNKQQVLKGSFLLLR